jgi:methylmalonyl-CoA mutase C-terminal domain/subunit
MREAARKFDAEDIPIIAGGFIPENDIPALEKMGVTGNFGAGTPHQIIVDHVRKVAAQKNANNLS